jgi:hypothetical protein
MTALLRDSGEAPRVVPAWRRRPCRATLAIDLDYIELCDTIDSYFEKCVADGRRPLLTEMTLAAGFDSFTQLLNHARRRGGETMRALSRAVLAISVEYEELLQQGSKGAMWMLEKMPEFDSTEKAAQAPARPFEPRAQINLNISGVVSHETAGAQLTAQQAYLQLIKHKSYEEMMPLLEAQQVHEGEFVEIEFPAGHVDAEPAPPEGRV